MPTTNVDIVIRLLGTQQILLKPLNIRITSKTNETFFAYKKEEKTSYDHRLSVRSYHRDSNYKNYIGDKLRVIENYDQPYAEGRVSANEKAAWFIRWWLVHLCIFLSRLRLSVVIGATHRVKVRPVRCRTLLTHTSTLRYQVKAISLVPALRTLWMMPHQYSLVPNYRPPLLPPSPHLP